MAVLRDVHKYPKSLQSNFIRDHSYEIAQLASRGLITTELPLTTGGLTYGRQWRITALGLLELEPNTTP